MLQINLLPVREARLKVDLREYVMQLFLVMLVVSGGIGIAQSRVRDQLENAQARVNQMDNDIRQYKPQLDQVAAFRKKKLELKKRATSSLSRLIPFIEIDVPAVVTD